MSATLELAKQLIQIDSITPLDKGCQAILIARLEKLGFEIKQLNSHHVSNFFASFGKGKPNLVFAGHTDVVPAGSLESWTSLPFTPTLRDGKLYGRGSADMKGSIAAFITAVERFLGKQKNFPGTLGLIITSDEEGSAEFGTRFVVNHLKEKNFIIDYCLIGEATCENVLGDTYKTGRRGSLSAHVKILGKQGHIAYPHLAKNPIHQALLVLPALINHSWNDANEYFQTTSLQISNLHSGTGTTNMIPDVLTLDFNLRYSPKHTAEQLQTIIEKIIRDANIPFEITWHHSGEPFFTKPAALAAALTQAIKKICKITPAASTAGGTSDGRFLIDISRELLEFGPLNKSIHQIDENINLADLESLSRIYEVTLMEIYGR